MFKVDHSQANEFVVVEPGEYEVTVINYELKKAESGNNRVVVDYEIRSDVDQAFQGQKLLYDNFTVTEKSMWRFQAASKAAQFPDGMQFNSYKEWADAFVNKSLRVIVGEREYNGKKYPEVKGFKVSKVNPPDTSITISDDDVPF
ncbi:DUF669 domain-containing protein [Priestia megaterium]|uniref:DUF669 domain-containing protein n=1 Tax=Priestia megaterium TaxID=1404 RepID=UPI0005C6EE07|nr:DUF669 domain-containing protein [Priestia megaterium]